MYVPDNPTHNATLMGRTCHALISTLPCDGSDVFALTAMRRALTSGQGSELLDDGKIKIKVEQCRGRSGTIKLLVDHQIAASAGTGVRFSW